MKNYLIIASIAFLAGLGNVYAQTTQPCDCEDLDANITSHTTLTENCYLLQGCVRVTSGFSLTIPAGTVIFADANAELQVERGAWLNVNGTSNNPVIFTSAQTVNNRTAGYWKGITIAGYGVNNINPGSTMTLERTNCNLLAGGSDNTDSSGVLQHLQIHYAGRQDAGESDVNGLTLASVGNRTVVENVQVTRSLTNGFSMIGGAVELKYLAAYNNINSDYVFSRGNVSLGQFLLSMRNDPNAYNSTDPVLSNGLLIENHPSDAFYATAPQTSPVLSNVSTFGPLYCDDEASTGTIAGVRFWHNTAGSIYNSFIGGYPTGLFIDGNLNIINAQNGLINFGYSSFFQNGDDFESDPINFNPNSDFCVSTVSDWMVGSGLCVEPGNLVMLTTPGYQASICNETYCGEENRPEFVLSTNNLADADFSSEELDHEFFTVLGINYGGSFGSTDWTLDWTDWCAQSTDYCPELKQRSFNGQEAGKLNIAPNPARGTAYALFDADQTGKVHVNVLDKITGQVLRSSSTIVSASGAQRVAIPSESLKNGVYIVQVTLTDGSVLTGQLFVW